MRDQLLHHHKRFERAYGEDPSPKSGKLLEARWGQMLNLVTIDGNSMIVYGANDSRENLGIEISKAIVFVLLRTIPGKPEPGKWTKDGPALDWFVALECMDKLLARLVHDA